MCYKYFDRRTLLILSLCSICLLARLYALALAIIFHKMYQLLIICVHVHVSPFLFAFFFSSVILVFCMKFLLCDHFFCCCFVYYRRRRRFFSSLIMEFHFMYPRLTLPTFTIQKWLFIFYKQLQSKRTERKRQKQHKKPDRIELLHMHRSDPLIYSFQIFGTIAISWPIFKTVLSIHCFCFEFEK